MVKASCDLASIQKPVITPVHELPKQAVRRVQNLTIKDLESSGMFGRALSGELNEYKQFQMHLEFSDDALPRCFAIISFKGMVAGSTRLHSEASSAIEDAACAMILRLAAM